MGEQAFAADDEPRRGANGHGNRSISYPPDWAGARQADAGVDGQADSVSHPVRAGAAGRTDAAAHQL